MITVDRLNAWLDALPRDHVRVGRRAVPAYLALGLAGLVSGTSLHVLLAAARGLPLGTTLGVTAVGCGVFVAATLARRGADARG